MNEHLRLLLSTIRAYAFLITHKPPPFLKASSAWGSPYCDICKAGQHIVQLEPSVMPVTKFRKVPGQMFWVDCMVSAVDGLLDIAYHGVYRRC